MSVFRRHAATFALLLAFVAPVVANEPPPTEFRPYEVAVDVRFGQSAEFPPAFQTRVLIELQQLLARTIGEQWSVTSLTSSQVPRSGGDLLASLSPASVPVERSAPPAGTTRSLPSDAVPDKLLFVVVAIEGSEIRVTAREWDRLTDTVGPLRTRQVTERSDVAHAIATATFAAFRPLALIESDDETTTLTLRAGGIPTPDPSIRTIAEGTLFLPFLRRFDRDGTLIDVQDVPYTLLQATEAEGPSVPALVHSALRSPLGVRRGRVEAWAIAAPSRDAATRLTLVRRDDGVPLSGRTVEIRTTPFQPGQEEPVPDTTLLSDRSGSVNLTELPNAPLVWLTIKSGQATLLRLPLAPGVEPQVTLPLGDDPRRLDAEGRLAILTGELIETVAKRSTLLARARSGARTGKYEEAEAALAEVEKLPGGATYRRRLAAIETPAAKAAEEDGDRLAAARIRALGRKAAGLIDRYLNPDTLRATREEVEELKRTDPDQT